MAAPWEAFPAVDRAAWEARLATSSPTVDLERWTPEGLVKRGLYTAGRASGPWGASDPVLGLSWLDEADPAQFRELAAVEFEGGARGLELVWHGAQHVSACLQGLPLDGMTLVLPSMADPSDVLSTLRQEVSGARTIGPADPLGALARDGDPALSPAECALALTAAVRDALGTAHRVGLIDTGSYHRSGAHAVQELAYCLATLAEYLRSCAAEEIRPEHAGAQLALAFDLGRDVFNEIAKLRAARLLWHKLFRAAGAESVPAPWIHARTSFRSLAPRDPWTNLLRGTTGSWAGVLGGADSLTCLPHDAAQGGGSQLGRRVARNIPLILAAEAHLTRVIDPAAGSHYVECRTDELARAAWELFRELERVGGMSACLRDGTVQAQVSASRQEWERRTAAGDLHVLGVTVHAAEEEPAS